MAHTSKEICPRPLPQANQQEARKQSTVRRTEEFSALPVKNSRKTASNQNTRTEKPKQTTSHSAMDDVSELNNEFAELNRLINIGQLERYVHLTLN